MDWLFRVDNNICNFRTAGVCVKDGKLFVQMDKRTCEYALAGGHVQVGETSEEALKREFSEEVGADIVCKKLVWTEECFWEWNATKSHTITFYYLIDFVGMPCLDGFIPQKDNEDVLLGWVDIDKLNDLTIYPGFLKTEIFDLDSGCKHFVTKE